MLSLLLATENAHKLSEMQAIFGTDVRLYSLRDLAPGLSLPEEGMESYEENAAQKAIYAGSQTDVLSLGDDSGFEVTALGNGPGVLSARFANTKDPSVQRKEILRQLEGQADRSCRFVCVLALFDPAHNQCRYFRGELEGTVAFEERGKFGFGYDSIVIPTGYTETLAEISSDVKNRISHRAQAIRNFLKGADSRRRRYEERTVL